MRNLRLAIGFLTIVPVAPAHAGTMAPARAYFPLVGLGIGGLLAGLDHCSSPGPAAARWLARCWSRLCWCLTRALHTEGFLDTCDGLLGGRNRESRLAILRDSHVGAFAVIGGACLLLLKWTLLAGIPEAERLGLLVLFPSLSRFAMVATMAFFPYARSQGLGTAFHDGASWRQPALALLTAAVAGGLLLGFAGLLLLGVATVVALGLGLWFLRLLGGMTGDTYGATNEVAEVTVLLGGLILIQLTPGFAGAPFW